MTRSHEIAIPFRDRNQPILEAVDDLRLALDGEERNLAREILSDALLNEGDRTVGDLLGRLEAASPDERRAVLDRARDQLGLPDVETVIVREKIEAGNRALRPGRDAEGKVIQMCPECGAVSSGPTGIPEPVADRKWWCASHKHLAGADDHLPPEDLDPVFDARTMSIRPNPAELERLRAEDERRAEEDRERNERRQAEAEAIKAARERYLEEADNLPDILGFHPRQVRHE